MPKCKNAKIKKCKNAKMAKCKNAAKTQKYNNAKLKIVSNVVRGPSCLSFPKPLGTVPLVPRASRRGFSNAKIPKYTKMPKCQNAAKIPKCHKMPQKCHKNIRIQKCKLVEKKII